MSTIQAVKTAFLIPDQAGIAAVNAAQNDPGSSLSLAEASLGATFATDAAQDVALLLASLLDAGAAAVAAALIKDVFFDATVVVPIAVDLETHDYADLISTVVSTTIYDLLPVGAPELFGTLNVLDIIANDYLQGFESSPGFVPFEDAVLQALGRKGVAPTSITLDATGLGATPLAPFNAAVFPNKSVTSIVFTGYDLTVGGENIDNVATSVAVSLQGRIFVQGLTLTHSAGNDSISVNFSGGDFGFALSTLHFLRSTGDQSVSVDASASSAIGQVIETDNHLGTLTISGPQIFALGFAESVGANLNGINGIVTDVDASATTPTTIASSLKLIDASGTTGQVFITAGDSTTAANGPLRDGTLLNSNVTITYDGLTIKGGSGTDSIINDANHGVVIVGGANSDTVVLGGSHSSAFLGTGANDVVEVGVQGAFAENPGQALGDTMQFGSPGTAVVFVGSGAEAGSTAGTAQIGETTIATPAAGLRIGFNFSPVQQLVDETHAVATASTLTTAENMAVAALHGPGVAYFTYGQDEYFVSTAATETKVSYNDIVVHLVGHGFGAFNEGFVVLHT